MGGSANVVALLIAWKGPTDLINGLLADIKN